MANKEDLLINQEILQSQRDITQETEKTYRILLGKRQATKEVLSLTREISDFAYEELQFQNESNKSLRSESDLLGAKAKNNALILKNKQMEADLTTKVGGDTSKLNKVDTRRLNTLRNQLKTGKSINASIDDQIKKREEINHKLGLGKKAIEGMASIPFLGQFVDSEKAMKALEETTIATGSGLLGMMKGLGVAMASIVKSPFVLIMQAALIVIKFMVQMAFQLSKNMTKVQTTTGLSAENSKAMFRGMQATSIAADKVYIQSTKILESFVELTEKTGMIANFGGDFLETMSTLKDRLGMSVDESEQLAYLTRLQGKDGDKILESQVKIVNQYNKQNKTLLSAKSILKSVAKVSGTVAVALGNSLTNITKAAAAATKLGLSMDEIHGAAGGFLDFQTSIQKELEFSLLTNQQVSFAKERQLALDNDMAGLAEALVSKESVLLAFRTGNRLQMDSAAAAMNMTSDQLSKIIRQEDYRKMVQEGMNGGIEEYIALYGEQSYLSLTELDAQEKINESIAQMKDRLLEVGETMLPLIERFAEFASNGENIAKIVATITTAMKVLYYATGAVVGMKIAEAIATAFASSMRYGPIIGAAAGVVAMGVIASSVKAPPTPKLDVKDAGPIGGISGVKVNTLPMDSIEIDRQNKSVSIGTNLHGGNMDAVVKKLDDVIKAVVASSNLEFTTRYDSFEASSNKASGGIKQTNTKYKSLFD